MSVSLSLASEALSPNATADVKRHSSIFKPSIWGEYFLSYASMEVDITLEQQVQQLKEEVKRMLVDNVKDSSQKLSLIDDIQRLGVSYHFENEICEILQQIFDNDNVSYDDLYQNNSDLYAVALRFRLLRQQGYNASSDTYFNNLKDNDGKFKESLVCDTKGLLGLYEATHLRIHGDNILDEALNFTTTHLESATHRGLSSPLLKQVTHALYQPLWKGLPRIEARHYLSTYQEDDSHNETLLNFARLDFNLLQQFHQKELCEITRWWKTLDFVIKNLSFARDRVVECYFWALGIFFEPDYYFARRALSKVICMVTLIDDIYDVYGTPEELELFNEAIQRWDISAIDQLPDYMKVCYQALLDVYTEIEEKLASEGNLYGIHHARESMKIHVDGYIKEARWLHSKYTPTLDEYMSVALSTSLYMLSITSAVVMGLAATKDSLDWLLTDPNIVNAASVVGRLLNDIMSRQLEQKRQHSASAVELYMKEHGATEEEAIVELTNQVNDAWKVINKACLHPTRIPLSILMRPLNHARLCEVIYKYEDAFTNAGDELKGFVTSLLIEPVPTA